MDARFPLPQLAAALLLFAACGGDDTGSATATSGGSGGAQAGSGGSNNVGGTSAGGAAGSGGSAGTAGGSAGTGGAAGGGGSTATGGSGRAGNVDASVDVAVGSDAPSDAASKGEEGAAMPPTDASACGSLPNSGVYATFRSGTDVFHVWITKPSGITHAIDLWKGQSTAKIPAGSLDCTAATFNCPWTWRMKPDTVDFADFTIELCDGLPSYVEAHCNTFANGTYCPWNAELTELRDCRTDPSCPMVPR
jgi:hypothetical protein